MSNIKQYVRVIKDDANYKGGEIYNVMLSPNEDSWYVVNSKPGQLAILKKNCVTLDGPRVYVYIRQEVDIPNAAWYKSAIGFAIPCIYDAVYDQFMWMVDGPARGISPKHCVKVDRQDILDSLTKMPVDWKPIEVVARVEKVQFATILPPPRKEYYAMAFPITDDVNQDVVIAYVESLGYKSNDCSDEQGKFVITTTEGSWHLSNFAQGMRGGSPKLQKMIPTVTYTHQKHEFVSIQGVKYDVDEVLEWQKHYKLTQKV